MKNLRYFITALALSLTTLVASAEEVLPASQLMPFNSIRVDADIELRLVAVAKGESPKITYDLGDADPEKFKFVVKGESELVVSLSSNTRSVSRVKATIYYAEIETLRVSYADVEFESPFEMSVADIVLDKGAKLSGAIDCADLNVSLAVDSRFEATGRCRYMTLKATTGSRAELRGIEITSATIDASQGAVVGLEAGERLAVSASTKGVVKYWGEPTILRARKASLLGGTIAQQKN